MLPEQEPSGNQGHPNGNDEPSDPPVDLTEDPDQRHPYDPCERRPEQRQREHARPVRLGRPFGGGGNRCRVRDADPDADERLCKGKHGELRRQRAHERADREDHERAEH